MTSYLSHWPAHPGLVPSLVPVSPASLPSLGLGFPKWKGEGPGGISQTAAKCDVHTQARQRRGTPEAPVGGGHKQEARSPKCVSLGKTPALSEPVSSPQGGWPGVQSHGRPGSGHSRTRAPQERNRLTPSQEEFAPKPAREDRPGPNSCLYPGRRPEPALGHEGPLCIPNAPSGPRRLLREMGQSSCAAGAKPRGCPEQAFASVVPPLPPFRSFQGTG